MKLSCKERMLTSVFQCPYNVKNCTVLYCTFIMFCSCFDLMSFRANKNIYIYILLIVVNLWSVHFL